MKKPEGKAEAGWYDAPEIEGYLQYWNGKFWTKKKQPKDGYENLEILPDYELGRLYFRTPYASDSAFISWTVIIGMLTFGRFSVNANTGGFDTSSTFSIVSGLIDAVFGTLLIAVFVWLCFLPYLIPRRVKDKKNLPPANPSIEVESSSLSEVSTASNKLRKKYLTVTVGLVLIFLLFLTQSKSGFEKDADAFFNKQQKISLVLNDWNKESALLLGLIQKVSNGELDYAGSVYSFNESQAKISPIINALREECADVPVQDLDKTGELQAIALAWNMLKVTCDLVPLQRIEYVAIFDAQWSESANQSKIDYHVERLSNLAQQRKDAFLQAAVELEKYAKGSQLEQLQSLIKLLS
jgi:hypothetical protein